ncbi:Arginine-tRNA-protein transferase, N-terminal [Kalmanozyma brasiliensis GHG001]|uniref:arginyltransferase n=1 Tax=Kalmanozyma brasiliensis (strain GHG001) TaxID=1365824 RepID=V5EZ80_KALBG|nr:Arginine-tRNA-protein transferase, N-terminal [Kalmanozyma brasiliensis GHG001]EST08139.1 Arginine-tRNA-protein transferase, N-terminal [Kalmanozyma brasiliensis GHG001]
MASKRTKTQLSIISPTGYSTSTCGYCTTPGSGERSATKSSKSYGIWAHRLSPYHYQNLIDQGWRRSGDYLYKPDLLRTCCAQIPIRLDAADFKPKKAHKRALTNLLFRVRQTKPKPAKWKGRWSKGRDWDVEGRWNEIVPSSAAQSTSSSSSPTWAESVAGPITRQLQVRLALAISSDEKYQLFRKYQGKVHGEAEEKISSEQGFLRFLVDTSLALTWPSTGLPLTPSQETHWRARSLDPADLPEELPYGCYHQEYRLDDKLIAVGVLDVLPNCVSSVYVFYDPEYNDWQLGKVSALQEIALTKRLGRLKAMHEITRYYMGFYIHTCQKMKYKAEYRPSQLLDCSDNTWHDLADVASDLDTRRYFAWSQDGQQQSKDKTEGDSQELAQSDEEDEKGIRVPTQPKPPPGMLSATAILDALQTTLRGADPRELQAELDLLQHAMVLEAQKQSEGIKPLLMSDLFRNYMQGEGQGVGHDDPEFVQVVECIAALASPELVAEMVLFM